VWLANVDQQCNDRLRLIFDDEKENVTTHLMRKLYGQMAYAKWGNGEDELEFVSEVLSHTCKSLDAVMTYLCVRIV
jgi:hypothetical protein